MTTEFTGSNADYLNQCTRKAQELERELHPEARIDAQDLRNSRWRAWDIQQRRATWQRIQGTDTRPRYRFLSGITLRKDTPR